MTPAERAQIESECTKLSYAFAYHLDHGNYRALADLFVPDGVFVRHDVRLAGQNEIVAALEQRPANQFTRHVTTNFHFIEVTETAAAAALVNLSWFSLAAEKLPIAFDPSNALLLDFDDRYVLTPNGWRFAQRVTKMLFVAPSLFSQLSAH